MKKNLWMWPCVILLIMYSILAIGQDRGSRSPVVLDSTLIDGVDSGSFLRSDQSDSHTVGTLNLPQIEVDTFLRSKYRDYDVKHSDYGAVGDNATDDRTAIAAADTAAVVAGVSLFFPPGTYKVSSDITIASDCLFAAGAMLSPDAGDTITINGYIVDTVQQIFTGSGAIAGTPLNDFVRAEWWGAVGDGATDDISAFDAAVSMLRSGDGGKVLLQAKIYVLSTAWDITPIWATISENINIEGVGDRSVLRFTGATNGLVCDNSGVGWIRGPNLNNLQIETTNAGALSAIYMNEAHFARMSNLRVVVSGAGEWTQYGIHSAGCLNGYLADTELFDAGVEAGICLEYNAALDMASNAWNLFGVQVRTGVGGTQKVGLLAKSSSAIGVYGGTFEGAPVGPNIRFERMPSMTSYTAGIVSGVHFENVTNYPNIDVDHAWGMNITGCTFSTATSPAIVIGNDRFTYQTATGGSTTTLIDTTVNFVDEGIVVNDYVWKHAGGHSRVSSITTTTNPNDTLVFPALTGGDSFGAGDTYSINADLVYNVSVSNCRLIDDISTFGSARDTLITDNKFYGANINEGSDDASTTALHNNYSAGNDDVIGLDAAKLGTDLDLTTANTQITFDGGDIALKGNEGEVSSFIQANKGIYRPNYVDDTGLVVYHPLNEGAGATVYDRSGENNDGTIVGASWTTSEYGTYLSFDGDNDVVTIPADASLVLGTGVFTIEAMVYVPSGRAGTGCWAGYDNVATAWYSYISSTGSLYFMYNERVTDHVVITDDEWHHIAFVRDANDDRRSFVDGELLEIDVDFFVGRDYSSNVNLYIGNNNASNVDFEGYISQFRMYKRALPDAEIRAHDIRSRRILSTLYGDKRIVGDLAISGGAIDWAAGNVTYVPIGADIQTYVTAATAGDTLVLASGAYTITTTITINKELNIKGQGRAGTVTIPVSPGHGTLITSSTASVLAFDITSDNARISDLSINLTGDSSAGILIGNNLVGVVLDNIDVIGESTGFMRGIEVKGSDTGIFDTNFYTVSSDGSAAGVYYWNDSTTTQDSMLTCTNVNGIVQGAVGYAYGMACYNVNDANTLTLNINSSVIRALPGTVLDVGVASTSVTTFNSTVNAYMCTLEGEEYDAYQTGTNVFNVGASNLENNLTLGTIIPRTAVTAQGGIFDTLTVNDITFPCDDFIEVNAIHATNNDAFAYRTHDTTNHRSYNRSTGNLAVSMVWAGEYVLDELASGITTLKIYTRTSDNANIASAVLELTDQDGNADATGAVSILHNVDDTWQEFTYTPTSVYTSLEHVEMKITITSLDSGDTFDFGGIAVDL